MKFVATFGITLALLFLPPIPANAGDDAIYQASTIQSLLNGLDGEMIALDGLFYRVDMQGRTHIVGDDMKTPFAIVTHFEKDSVATIKGVESIKSFEKKLGLILPSKNILYAIKIAGTFDYLKVRSVPKQIV